MPASEANIISQCGCEIRAPGGPLAVNLMRACAFEANLIRKHGYRSVNTIDYYICNRVTKRRSDVGEAETPQEFVEYSFFLPNSNVRPQTLLRSNVDEEIEADLQKCNSTQEMVDVIQRAQGSPGGDLRDSELVGGHEVHRGVYEALPVKTPCINILDLARNHRVPSYLRAIREALPGAIMEMKERDFLRKIVAGAHYNAAEAGNNQVQFTKGAFAHKPLGGPQISLFREITQLLKANRYRGKVEIPMNYQCLQSMFIAYHAAHGSMVEVQKWVNGGGLPASGDDENQFVEVENMRFRLCDLPHRGYFKEIGTDNFEFMPIDARTIELPEEGAGVIARVDKNFFKSFITCDGQRRENVEMIPIFDPDAFVEKPFAQVDPGVKGDVRAHIWGGTQIQVVSGADIVGNTRRQKFFFQGQHSYKVHPEHAYRAAVAAIRVTDFIQVLNQLGLTERALASTATVGLHPGENPPANSYADGQAGLDAFAPAPLPVDPAAGCGRPNDEGEFYIQCAADTVPGAGTVTIIVERRNGYSGAASIQADTADDTAVAGTDYTAVAAEVLSWADGEGGFKSFDITIDPDANDDTEFDVNFTNDTGAEIAPGLCSSTKVKINAPVAGAGY